jgi:hypothetical protein
MGFCGFKRTNGNQIRLHLSASPCCFNTSSKIYTFLCLQFLLFRLIEKEAKVPKLLDKALQVKRILTHCVSRKIRGPNILISNFKTQ